MRFLKFSMTFCIDLGKTEMHAGVANINAENAERKTVCCINSRDVERFVFKSKQCMEYVEKNNE